MVAKDPVWVEKTHFKGHEETFWSDGSVLCLNVVTVTQPYTFVKTHHIIID